MQMQIAALDSRCILVNNAHALAAVTILLHGLCFQVVGSKAFLQTQTQ